MERQLQDAWAHAGADLAVRLDRSERAERRSARANDELADPPRGVDRASGGLWLEPLEVVIVGVDDDVCAGGVERLIGRRALTNANVKSNDPIPTNSTRLVIAQDGIFAVNTT